MLLYPPNKPSLHSGTKLASVISGIFFRSREQTFQGCFLRPPGGDSLFPGHRKIDVKCEAPAGFAIYKDFTQVRLNDFAHQK